MILSVDVPLSNSLWHCLLPFAQSSPSRLETTEFVDRSPYKFLKACWFWIG